MYILIDEEKFDIVSYTPQSDYIKMAFGVNAFKGSVVDGLKDVETISVYDGEDVIATYQNISMDSINYQSGIVTLRFRIDGVDDKIANVKSNLNTMSTSLTNVINEQSACVTGINDLKESATETNTNLTEISDALLELSDFLFEFLDGDNEEEEETTEE